MTKINLITFPDKLYDNTYSILVLYPSKQLQDDLQNQIFAKTENDLNVYIFNDQEYFSENVDWMLTVSQMADLVIVDIDNCESFIRNILAILIAKSKTYWLTNSDKTLYNHVSKNRIYTLDGIKNIGDIIVKRTI